MQFSRYLSGDLVHSRGHLQSANAVRQAFETVLVEGVACQCTYCCVLWFVWFFFNVLLLCISIPVLLSCFFEFLFLCWQWSTYEKKLEWQAVSHNRISLLYTKLICIHRTSGCWQEYFWFWVGFEYILSKQSSSCLIRFYFTYPSEEDFK